MAETIPIPSRGEIKKLLLAKLSAWKEQKLAGGFSLPSALRVAQTDRRLMTPPGSGAEPTANWFYTYTSLESTQCVDVPQLASGVRTDTCLVDVMRNDSSVYITCDAGTNSVTVIAYNNTMCNPALNDNVNITAPLGCVPPDAAEITDEGDVLSYLNGCTFDSGNHSSASPYPLPEGGNYATFSFYDDSFCAAALSFQGLLNGACLPANEHASIRVQYPDVVYFALSPSCQGPSTTVAKVFEESCTMNDDHLFIGDDGGDDSTDDALSLSFEYRRAALYGNAPTPSPVQQPTRAPEELGWVVSFVSPGDTCSKSAPFARGYATNACMAAGNLQSVMYSCREQGVMKTVYDSVDCDPDTVANYVRIPKGCFTEFDEGMEMDVAAEYMCKTGNAEIVLPNDDDYAVYEYYDQAGCETLLHYSAIKNKNCIGLNGKSLYVDYPNQFAFPESEHCTGTNSSRMAYIQTCTGGYFGEVMGPQARQRILEAKLDDVASPTFTYKWSSLTAGPASASSSSSSSTTLSTGAIAGIAIGGVALVVAVAVALYFLVFAAAASTKAPSAPPSAVEIPETDNDKKKILEGERSDA